MGYDDARRHIQLWVYWPRCLATLERLEEEARKAHVPFTIPGLRRLLTLAGVAGVRHAMGIEAYDPKNDPSPAPLPNDIAGLRRALRRLMAEQRELRAQLVQSQGALKYAHQQLRISRAEGAALRRQIRQMPNRRR